VGVINVFNMELKYTKEHEWLKIEGDVVHIGITNHAAEALGTLVFVELPSIGKNLKIGDACGVVESAKSASDVYSPVAGEIIEINKELENKPELINELQEGDAWICKIKVTETSVFESYMSKIEYEKLLEN
jgi:glycine cleavage system H protein